MLRTKLTEEEAENFASENILPLLEEERKTLKRTLRDERPRMKTERAGKRPHRARVINDMTGKPDRKNPETLKR